ncbi:hypothetical protein NDU88_005860 [Pleurodeles waltl]|uniref:Uncharacterized protein n=1 Tax=Pleurodeles waltl TaxID=8319 RepID=A0AAV7SMW8_PLEWA|nr:hypothetical protein NDU88_005860 [Pleurodeles waltl]
MVIAQEYCDQVEAITAAARVQAWKGLITQKYGLRIVVMPGDQRRGDAGPGNDCGGRWRDPTRKPARGHNPSAGTASQSDAVTAEPAGRCSSPAAGVNSRGTECPAFHGLAVRPRGKKWGEGEKGVPGEEREEGEEGYIRE